MNNWNIPDHLEKLIRNRDTQCVYCGKEFSKENPPTWEHIINDEKIITFESIALCCRGCNSSKGQKLLKNWLQSDYCKNKNISIKTVAPIIKLALNE